MGAEAYARTPWKPSSACSAGMSGARAASGASSTATASSSWRRPSKSAKASAPDDSAELLETLGFTGAGADWRAAGAQRSGFLTYDTPPVARGVQGAGTVHHVAWSAADDAELEAFRGLARQGGAHPTPIIDRQYFHSVYFREPSGVLFEIADDGPGFTVDGPVAELGRRIILPPRFEQDRAAIEERLTPLPDPRADWPAPAA